MRDLEGIAQLYLGLAGADSAEKFIDEILHTVDLLRTFPYSGALHPDMVLAEREFRKVVCRDYVCVYKVIDSEKTIYITTSLFPCKIACMESCCISLSSMPSLSKILSIINF